MIILGIDPGSAIIGYGAIENKKGELKYLDCGVIKIEAVNQGRRLEFIEKEIAGLLKKFKPDKVILEKLFFYKNLKTAGGVFEARGVIILAVSRNNIPFVEITPSQLKRALTNFGGAKKSQIQKMLKLILNLEKEPKPDDAADALALAVVGPLTQVL